MRGRKVQSINATSLERCYILIMKLHVSAYNGHRQVSTTIKKSLYICSQSTHLIEKDVIF